MPEARAVGNAAVGTAALPFGALNAIAARRLIVREIHVFNVGSLAARIRIARSTTAHTGTALTEKASDDTAYVPVGVALKDISAAGTIEADDLDVGAVGAQVGSGFVYTYYGEGRGLYIPAGTANGIVLIEEVDTANSYDFTIVWDE